MITYRLTEISLDDDFYIVHGNASEQAPNGQFTEIHLRFSLEAAPNKTVAQFEEEFLALAKANVPVIHHPTGA